jgi:hypothetical protein
VIAAIDLGRECDWESFVQILRHPAAGGDHPARPGYQYPPVDFPAVLVDRCHQAVHSVVRVAQFPDDRCQVELLPPVAGRHQVAACHLTEASCLVAPAM